MHVPHPLGTPRPNDASSDGPIAGPTRSGFGDLEPLAFQYREGWSLHLV